MSQEVNLSRNKTLKKETSKESNISKNTFQNIKVSTSKPL